MTLYIFDKDGTLVAGVPKADGKTRPANKPEEQILLPGVARKICQLRSQGHLIAIASNQGGCAWGVMTTNEAELLMKDCADKIGGVNAMIYSPYDPKAAGTPRADARYAIDHENRKPRPGMITHYAGARNSQWRSDAADMVRKDACGFCRRSGKRQASSGSGGCGICLGTGFFLL